MSDSFLWVDAGHVIANLTLSGNCNVTSYTPSRSDRYFSMIESVLTLKEELDLDAGLQIQTLHVLVEPINEFPPYFFARPYNITISEVKCSI
ncbi:hypothetical protein DPMN_003533 [Dreissena polymorpha]|uniref:Uncharacterized protein n=1 Tax=Dreissena polymorpha TaxID=45954 RepID=A0A9D4MQU5_DREPO|nr:hypothetical protein DPMN_003533 [Dreissena polymorpha]